MVRSLAPAPEGVNVEAICDQVKYVGSAEHKDTPSFAGEPRPRADAAICDRSLAGSQDLLTDMLRAAIRKRAFGGLWEGGFPRYVWHRPDTETLYEARLVNREAGWYKGFPLDRDEWPEGVKISDE
jgi:hypothetical protein